MRYEHYRRILRKQQANGHQGRLRSARRRPEHRAAVAVTIGRALLAAAVVQCGCAVNDHGLVRVRRYENDSACVVRLESWGVHLLTAAGDGGLNIGYLDRTYVFKKGDADARIPLATLTGDDGGMRPAACDACPALAAAGMPVFRAGRGLGVVLDANSSRTGIAFGMRLRAALALPATGSTVVLLRYDTGDTGPPVAVIGKEIER